MILSGNQLSNVSAFQTGLIDYDDFWLEMTDLRNEIVHAYDEKFAEKIYEKFSRVLGCFKTLGKKIGESK